MGLAEGLLIVAIVCVFAFFVLRPDRFGRKSRGDSGGGDAGTGGYYSSDGNHSHDLTTDSGGDSGSDGGGGGDGGSGD